MSDKHKKAALARGVARTAEVERKVLVAMDTIMAEMKTHDGIYPENGGAVSKNEVARRAGISLGTLHAPKQKVLSERVDLWLETLKKKESVGRMKVRRTAQQQYADCVTKYKMLDNNYRKTELELQHAQSSLDDALAANQKLRDECAALLEQLRTSGATKVTAIKKGKD